MDPLHRIPRCRYRCRQRLGQGASGVVYEAEDLLSPSTCAEDEFQRVAIKFIKRDACTAKSLETEVMNLRKLDHPHIVELKEIFLIPDYLCLVMEYAAGGTLEKYIRKQGKPLQEEQARWFFQQLMLAIDYSHRRGIVNRDVKLENSLLMDTNPPLLKISDFGLSKDACHSSPRSLVGTLRGGYMAPEVLEAQGRATYDGKAADVWSCGVMLYYMLYCRGPFSVQRDAGDTVTLDVIRQMLQLQRSCQYTFPDHVPISGELRQLLKQMLHPNPSQRIRVADIMAHPWFTRGLPEGAADMNAQYLEQGYTAQQERQPEVYVQAIFEELRRGSRVRPSVQPHLPRGEVLLCSPGPAPGAGAGAEGMKSCCIDAEIAGYYQEHPDSFEMQLLQHQDFQQEYQHYQHYQQ